MTAERPALRRWLSFRTAALAFVPPWGMARHYRYWCSADWPNMGLILLLQFFHYFKIAYWFVYFHHR